MGGAAWLHWRSMPRWASDVEMVDISPKAFVCGALPCAIEPDTLDTLMSRSSFVVARLRVASVMFGSIGGLSGDARRWFFRGGLPSSADELWPLSRSQSISRPELLSGAARRPMTSDISSSKRAASIC